jgi:signal transduction histidine kinase
MKTEMMNVVVHELRNPVSSIMGFSDILLNDKTVTETESQEFMTHIMSSSQKLNALINRFLDISRLESRRIEYPKKLIDCAACVREVAKSQQPQLLHKSLTAEIDIAEDVPEIFVVPDLFREAVLNLLSNAVKYGEPGRTIDLKLIRTENELVFSITDHGYGIPPEAQEKLFTKFYRVQNPKSIKEIGTGLGLAYVKEIAEYHHGSITLESNAEIGSRFTLSLPIITHEPAAAS